MGDTTNNRLCAFCRNITEDISLMKNESAGDSESEIVLNVYEEKCMALLEDLEKKTTDLVGVSSYRYIQSIAQLVLDLTYVEECKLVDEEFLQESTYSRLKFIIGKLLDIENLARDVAFDKTISDVLSPEIVECLHWRKGALFYMFCHTMSAQHAEKELPPHYMECLENGIKYLVAMLSTRSSPKWLQDYVSDDGEKRSSSDEDDECSKLLAHGILSDTHLLALMYCGEMCYWHTQAVKKGFSATAQGPASQQSAAADKYRVCIHKDSLDRNHEIVSGAGNIAVNEDTVSGHSRDEKLDGDKTSKFRENFVAIGKHSLQTYISAANGPMAAGGWNTTRAEEILQYLESIGA